jgi:hypothetical protein
MSLPAFTPTDQPKPLYFTVTQPQVRNRLTAALRLIWVIPQFFVLFFVAIAAFVVGVIGWFGALFTGQLPDFAKEFLSGFIRWDARVTAYANLLTDEYPPFSLEEDPAYPVQIAIPPAARLNPLSVFFRIVLVIPAAIVSGIVGSGVWLLAAVSWATITFAGTQPIPLYEAIRVVTRYQVRLYGYFWMLTPEYPWGVLGDATAGTTGEAPPEGWSLQLSDGGKIAVYVAIALGIITTIYRYH